MSGDFQLFLGSLLHNDSLNLTEAQLQEALRHLELMGNVSESRQQVDCGGEFEIVARIYAHEYHPYLAIAVCLFGTVANILNIAVLTRKDMACAPINRILKALAVADMILMIEYIPYAYYDYIFVKKKMDFPYPGAVYMLFHAHITQILHTTSICLTLTLAIWRYLAIGYPQYSSILCSDSRCTIAISLSYIIPIILCIPNFITFTIIGEEITEDNQQVILYHTDLTDTFKNDRSLLRLQFWTYAVFMKLLPCCILTVISLWLIYTLFKAKKRKQVLRGYDCVPLRAPRETKKKATKAERRADRTTKMLVAVLTLFLITEFPQGIFALLIAIKGKDLFVRCYLLYGEIMDILALINGAINFILYCCMNRMFRTTFGQLFKHKILAQWAPSSEMHTTMSGNGTHATEL
ncbi:G-protein coupled receptor dmsr-1-like isoform X2 [Tribolium madens]|uniref:G-protein coupled receptor dmsr-1-like isoform X2 n=1 Tax=Tribolium madens TaxID=41895 RepID=UPI001CF73744|nr:G-protein coupled receptor dmsr-1-like isoform X2 [Tribolium madens]